MRAVVLSGFGATPELVDLPTPEAGDGEVRVAVRAASVNGFDLAVANGSLQGMMEHRFPVVLGKDFAGVVDQVGEGVEGYSVGDRVFGVVTKSFLGDGSFGDFVVVPTDVGLAKIPESVDFTTASTLGLAGSAAVDVFDAAQVAAGQTVLVAGATGGVGNQVAQLALKAGAHVIATAHTDDEIVQVTALGVSEIVDYTGNITAQLLAANPAGVDVVVHLAGNPAALVAAVKKGGRLVSTLLGSPDQVFADGVTVVPVMAHPAPGTLDRVAQNQVTGHTAVTVQEQFELSAIADAFAAFGNGTLGKLVVTFS